MSFFEEHGTKVLGSLTAMAGAAQMGLASLDGTVMTHPHALIADFFLGVAIAGLGGGTIVRGFSNSRNQGDKQ